MERAAILFVEDNEDLRDNAALVLGLEGYVVEVAKDGQEALDVIESGFAPNLIVSDIMMPRMDGYQFFEAVREKQHLKGVPFIFLTARGSRQDVSMGRMLGADDYLVKPFDPEEFLIAVRNKLRRTQEMREQAAASLDDARRLLVQVLSHELRAPLTYVTGGFALLAEELESYTNAPNGDDIQLSLDLIQSGTQRLNRLAEQMVLYSQIISGYIEQKIKAQSEYLELDYLLHDATTLLAHKVLEHGVTVQHTVSEQSLLVFGIKDLLVTAIGEVLRNAVEYSPQGGEVGLSITAEDDMIVLTVSDQGPGIAPEQQLDIWEVLIQSERDRDQQQGVGMGLPIVKGIITAHSGEVALTSTPGEGAQIMLRLPLAQLPDA